MISAHLPAGTKIICLSYKGSIAELTALKVGNVYTLRGYDPYCRGFGVLLAEWVHPHPQGGEYAYSRTIFRVAAPLPASITDCLNVRAPEMA